jgi:hypothetical protein
MPKKTVRSLPGLRQFRPGLDSCLSQKTAERILSKAQCRYCELLANCEQPSNRVLRKHLVEHILPGLALYQVLLAEGFAQEAAQGIIDSVFATRIKSRRKMMALWGRLPFFYHLIRLLIRKNMRADFPADGWDIEWVEVSSKAVAFTIHQCFYLKVLTSYGAAELTRSFCRIDDLIFENISPHLRWERTMTLGRQDRCCDFLFRRV